MAKSKENKTQASKKSVAEFIASIKEEVQRKDAKAILAMMKKASGAKPVMWGSSMVGFGKYQYKRRDGSEHEFFKIGFSPRKGNLSIYIMPVIQEAKDLLKKLGAHKTGVGCLYIKRLADVDLKVLERLIRQAYKDIPNKMNY